MRIVIPADAGIHRGAQHACRMVDPAVVLQRLVVSASDLPNSYLGPPESYYRRGTP